MKFRLKFVQLLQIQTGRDVRRFHDGCSRRRSWRRFLRCGRSSMPVGANMRPHSVGEVVIKRTRMGFLVLNAQPHQALNNHIAFYFQFTCQFIDPNLPHA